MNTADLPLVPVVSSNVEGYRYDSAARALLIQFKGGSRYRYTDVPADIALGLSEAESVGKFIAASIKGKFPAVLVPRQETPAPVPPTTPKETMPPVTATLTPTREMPRYRSHKLVHALQIGQVIKLTDGSGVVVPSDTGFADVPVDESMFARYSPGKGDYLVIYEDGYRSFSPGDAFETGYTSESSGAGLRREQEPKFNTSAIGRLVNRGTGVPIPDWEPVMIFRAQDRKAVDALAAYALVVADPQHRRSVEERIEAFREFAEQYPERMQEPDTELPRGS